MYKDLLFPKTENNTCTFSPVSFAHRGEYWCVAGNDTALYSNPVDIRVSALPKASLTVEPKWRPLYHGETVTLKCEVDRYSNWTYFWYTEQRHRATSLTKEYNVTISGAAGSDQGKYWCEGRLEGRNVTSQRSDSITLTAAAVLLGLKCDITAQRLHHSDCCRQTGVWPGCCSAPAGHHYTLCEMLQETR
ncbi:hypothetical protein SKAU_G00276030 [Synaphobranchus kaupii]|uniref:Ig-like domain-containing protein n=1 Tax=Synaphobranchus kaupii TaxID=118154 RepID=A0A9Q1F150_SYNKA|nr:hypothetical protein SKAU_G00276030 [Synaphobranchus kaupii]